MHFEDAHPVEILRWAGETYGDDLVFPLGPDENGNPNFKGCTDLKA